MSSLVVQHEQLPEKLQAWTRAAIATIAGSPNTADTVSGIIASVQCILQGVAHRCNGHHRLLSLPQGLLLHVLDSVRPDDIWALSQTCRHLRDLCLSTPSLWRSVPWSRFAGAIPASSAVVQRAALLAHRSHPERLDYRINLLMRNPEEEAAVSNLLEHILPRLSRLWLSSISPNTGLLPIFEMPAPALQELMISRITADVPTAGLPCDFLGGGVETSLHTLQLYRVTLPTQPSSALSNLRAFKWSWWELHVDPALVCFILALMPRLVSLDLDVSSFTWCDSEAAIPDGCCLCNFSLSTYRPLETSEILAFLRRLHITFFHCEKLSSQDMAALLEQPMAASFGQLFIDVTVGSTPTSKPLIVRGNTESWGNTSNAITRHLPEAFFSALTELSLDEFYWPSAHVGAPPMNRLRHLRLSLAYCRLYRDRSWPPTVGILTAWDLAAWETPMLDTIDFVHHPPRWTCRQSWSTNYTQACSCAERLTISLRDVQHFVELCLPRPHGRRFSRVSLLGVEVVDLDPWAALALLESTAEEVVLSPVAVLTKFEIDDRNPESL